MCRIECKIKKRKIETCSSWHFLASITTVTYVKFFFTEIIFFFTLTGDKMYFALQSTKFQAILINMGLTRVFINNK